MIAEQHTIEVDIQVLSSEVLRMMGCANKPASAEKHLDLITPLITEAAPLLQPRAVYVVRDVLEMGDDELTLNEGPVFHGPVAGFLKPAERIAVFVVTIGPAIEQLSKQRMGDGDILEGFVLDAIGSAAVDATADALVEHLRRQELRPDEELTPPFSPGYCGMSVREQETLFAIVDTTSIRVTLTESCFMQPLKSISGMIGIGNADQVVDRGSPCQWCDLAQCNMRRE